MKTQGRLVARLALAALALPGLARADAGQAGRESREAAASADTAAGPGLACVVDPGLVEVFPRWIDWRPPASPVTAGGDTLAHFVICEVAVDTTGRPYSVRALGCEGSKGVLCDWLIAALKTAMFSPALQGGKPVPAVIVLGATFAAGVFSRPRLGPPVVGAWDDSTCSYRGRICGSSELDPPDRPYVRERVPAVRPRAAGAAASAKVQLRLIVDPDGLPCFFLCEQASPPDQGFVEAAVAAARRYRFEPGRKLGVAQAVWVTIDFRWE